MLSSQCQLKRYGSVPTYLSAGANANARAVCLRSGLRRRDRYELASYRAAEKIAGASSPQVTALLYARFQSKREA